MIQQWPQRGPHASTIPVATVSLVTASPERDDRIEPLPVVTIERESLRACPAFDAP
jgi:hypothetical protein